MDGLLELIKLAEERQRAAEQEIAMAQAWLAHSRQVRRADLRRRMKLLRSRAERARIAKLRAARKGKK